MKKLKSLHSGTADLRQRIIQNALSCFIENGYSTTSISDICQKSDISVGSLYHHFKSKEQLARAIYIEGIKKYQLDFIEELNISSTARDGIFNVVKYHLNWISKYSLWAKFLILHRNAEFMGENENNLMVLNREFFNNVNGWLKNRIKAGEIRRMPSDIFLCLLIGPCQEYARIYLYDKAITDIEKTSSLIAAGIWKSLSI